MTTNIACLSLLQHRQQELASRCRSTAAAGRPRGSRATRDTRVLHEARELAMQVGIEPVQRFVQPRLARGGQVEVPLHQLAVALDPVAPVEAS